VDFPPFSFLDQTSRLAGFHIDLARAICAELEVIARCQIQALPWNELPGALKTGQAEAIISGMAMTPESTAEYRFTRAYLTCRRALRRAGKCRREQALRRFPKSGSASSNLPPTRPC
jgi:ABC-type amino acid transport substrate-binding protein